MEGSAIKYRPDLDLAGSEQFAMREYPTVYGAADYWNSDVLRLILTWLAR